MISFAYWMFSRKVVWITVMRGLFLARLGELDDTLVLSMQAMGRVGLTWVGMALCFRVWATGLHFLFNVLLLALHSCGIRVFVMQNSFTWYNLVF